MKKIIFLVIILIFNSCGGGSSTSEKTVWGIDQNSGKPLPVCNGNQVTTTNAITIEPETKILNTKNSTYLRIWHYQSGIKKACVIQGEAVFYD